MVGTCCEVPDVLSLKINADGISISKSSEVECWPLLVEIAELPNIPPGIIGIYCEEGKPKDLDSYLGVSVIELNDFLSNGHIQNARKLDVKLKCFIADSPARALLKSRFHSHIKN